MVTVRDNIGRRKTAPSGNAPELRGDLFDPTCPTRRLLDRIGGKWTSMLVKVLADAGAEVRFAELQRRAAGISRKMLAQTLRELERDGLVARRVEPTVPPAVHYRLTALGQTLEEPLEALRNWAEGNMPFVDGHRATFDAERESDRDSDVPGVGSRTGLAAPRPS